MTAAGIGAAVNVSQRRHTYCVREQARRFQFQLLADVFADPGQGDTALTALAGLRLMAVLDARAMPVAAACGRHACAPVRQAPGGEFFLDGAHIHIDRYLEQQALVASACLTGLAESAPAVVPA